MSRKRERSSKEETKMESEERIILSVMCSSTDNELLNLLTSNPVDLSSVPSCSCYMFSDEVPLRKTASYSSGEMCNGLLFLSKES
jgi:hypothetical protein